MPQLIVLIVLMPFLLPPYFLSKCLLPYPQAPGGQGVFFETAVLHTHSDARPTTADQTVLTSHQTSVWFPFSVSFKSHSSFTLKIIPSYFTAEKSEGQGFSTLPKVTDVDEYWNQGPRPCNHAVFTALCFLVLLSLDPELETWDLVIWKGFTLFVHAQFIIFSKHCCFKSNITWCN